MTTVVIYDDYRTMIAEAHLDAVDICLPHHLHADAIIAAAEAGLHVLCEKPLCLTVEEADSHHRGRRADRRDASCARTTSCSSPRWQRPSGCWIPACFGRVYEVRTTDSFYNDFTPESMGWRAHAATAGGGELIDTGYHPLYLLQHLAGGDTRRGDRHAHEAPPRLHGGRGLRSGAGPLRQRRGGPCHDELGL